MTEKFLICIGWKAFFYLYPDCKPTTKDTFGFKSSKPTPHIKELDHFETEIYNLLANIKFESFTNQLQTEMRNNVKDIKDDDKMTADRTTNFYKLSTSQYRKLI